MNEATPARPKKRRSFLSRHPRLKRIVYTGYGALFVPLLVLSVPLRILPRGVVYALARRVAWLVVAPFLRGKITRNLYFAYGARMTPRRARALTLKISANVVWSAVDCYYMWVWWWTFRPGRTVIRIMNPGPTWQALDHGKGQFMVTPHYQCFEIMPVYVIHYLGLHGGVIARAFPSPVLNWMNRRVRLLHGVPSYYNQMRDVVRQLRTNGVIGFLPDLNARKSLAVPSTFYGKPTLTLDIHVRVAGQIGCLIIPAFLMRHKARPWQYTLLLYEAIRVPHKPDAAQIQASVQAVNDAFEHHIRRYPSGWIWFHNKWGLW